MRDARMNEQGKVRVRGGYDRESTQVVWYVGFLTGLLIGLSVSFFFFLYHALKLGG